MPRPFCAPLLPRGIFDKETRRKTVAVAGAAMELGARIGLHASQAECRRFEVSRSNSRIDPAGRAGAGRTAPFSSNTRRVPAGPPESSGLRVNVSEPWAQSPQGPCPSEFLWRGHPSYLTPGACPLPLESCYFNFASARARLKTARNMGRVSLPVLVFCSEGW
jgi:hypothetical protein